MTIVGLETVRDQILSSDAARTAEVPEMALVMFLSMLAGEELCDYEDSPRKARPTRFTRPLWNLWIQKYRAHATLLARGWNRQNVRWGKGWRRDLALLRIFDRPRLCSTHQTCLFV